MRHADYSWQVRMYLHPVVIYLDHACGYSRSTRRKRVWPAGNSTVRVAPHATRVTDACTHRHVTGVWLRRKSCCCQNAITSRTPPSLWAPPTSDDTFLVYQIPAAILSHFECMTRVGNQLISLLISTSSIAHAIALLRILLFTYYCGTFRLSYFLHFAILI